jgi:hypothetical protein
MWNKDWSVGNCHDVQNVNAYYSYDIHYDRNRRVLRVCFVRKKVRIFDPCYASTAILSETINNIDETRLSKWINIYKNIIYGYDSIAKLSKDEKTAMPYIIVSNQLISCAWFSEQEKYQEQYKANLKMTKWIVDNFDKLLIE